MKAATALALCLASLCAAFANAAQPPQIADTQLQFVKRYEKQKLLPKPEAMLLNTDAEPDLSHGFTPLYNGKNLDGWTPRGGSSPFEAQGEVIYGEIAKGSPSTYLCTNKNDYSDFIFTAEFNVEGNSGVMLRAKATPGKRYETVTGPQIEVEEKAARERNRLWTGGIYGQGVGGWIYPLWLTDHEAARNAGKAGEWVRITVEARGDAIKSWVNGVPAAHWKTDVYREGFIGLQIHSGKAGLEYRFRNIRIKELPKQ